MFITNHAIKNISADHSWDDQLKQNTIILTVQSGNSKSIEYDMTILGQQHPLTYENYFYIALSSTCERFILLKFCRLNGKNDIH